MKKGRVCRAQGAWHSSPCMSLPGCEPHELGARPHPFLLLSGTAPTQVLPPGESAGTGCAGERQPEARRSGPEDGERERGSGRAAALPGARGMMLACQDQNLTSTLSEELGASGKLHKLLSPHL